MRFQGTLSWLAYNFSRHRFCNLAMTWWLLGLTAAWIALLALGIARPTPVGIAAAVLAVLVLLAVAVGSRGSHVVFRRAELNLPTPARRLKSEERVEARATGFFEVGGMRKHFVGVQAWFETVETREHIVIARNPQSRFLLLARTREHESGMWYVFFHPEHIRSVEQGFSFFGWSVRPALRIAFQPPDRKAAETVCLAFEDLGDLNAVLADLCLDGAADGVGDFRRCDAQADGVQ
jgi:hypothetical protein